MLTVSEGQCGLCAHFGDHRGADYANENSPFIQIRTSRQAAEDFLADCGNPTHAQLHLKVTPISGCEGFTPAQ
ncbi:MAG: hypothetical protein ACFCVE_06650 [Phycisphaerae bacterium]